MNMVDWKSKLTSRKFWVAVVGLVTGIMMAFKVDAETVETVSGVIMAGASVIAYIIGEGLADAAGASNKPPIIFDAGMFEDDPEDKNDVEEV